MRRWCAGGRRRCRARCSALAKAVWRPDLYDAALGARAAPSPGEPADGIGAFAGPAFDPDDIEAHLAAWKIKRVAAVALRHASRGAVAGTGGLADNDDNKRGNAMNRSPPRLASSRSCSHLSRCPRSPPRRVGPTRQINAIVPLGAGSASDIIARVVMEQVGRQVGQTVVVENRPGAGGTIGANMVAKAAPDGYTVLVYGALASAHALHEKLPYDTLNDLIPVASLGQQILVIISSPGKGYKTLGDLIAAAKAKPGALNYSSAGVGSASHIGAERLRTSVNFEAQHIPFKGAAEAVTDVIAERVDFSVQLPATTLPLLKDGKLVALAVSAQKRAGMFPDVPTTIEAGCRRARSIRSIPASTCRRRRRPRSSRSLPARSPRRCRPTP